MLIDDKSVDSTRERGELICYSVNHKSLVSSLMRERKSRRSALTTSDSSAMVSQQQTNNGNRADSPNSGPAPKFGSLLVDRKSSTPYSDATQVGILTSKSSHLIVSLCILPYIASVCATHPHLCCCIVLFLYFDCVRVCVCVCWFRSFENLGVDFRVEPHEAFLIAGFGALVTNLAPCLLLFSVTVSPFSHPPPRWALTEKEKTSRK